MLIDREIREALASGELTVNPSDSIDSRIQPASLDVRLGHGFGVFRRRETVIDPKVDVGPMMRLDNVDEGGHYVVFPGEMILAHTLEEIELADTLAARVEGKSSLGRLGLLVHTTAGFVDPGWALATITLEISTVSGLPIKLYPGMPIAQLAFERVAPGCAVYGGKYVKQAAPTPSRFHQNWLGSRWA